MWESSNQSNGVMYSYRASKSFYKIVKYKCVLYRIHMDSELTLSSDRLIRFKFGLWDRT